jgi:hypothetical protein
MSATPRRVNLALIISAFVFAFVNPIFAQDEQSHARIVRLSFVEGNVTLLRPASVDWATAAVNTPIEEGFQLSTDKNSFAEVEFENGSTARVGELSLLKFDQLALSESGEEMNLLTLDQGYGTFNLDPAKVSSFEVRSGDSTFTAQGRAEFRIDLDQRRIRLEVFKGSVQAANSDGSTTVAKDGILEIAPGTEQAFNLSSGIQRDDWDNWVAARDQQQAASAALPPGGLPPGAPAYGWSDLDQNGTWSYFNGYGYGWVPDAWGDWSPFGLGDWAWYPGWGYTWIGYEPWGWLPYHFGGWMYDAMFGWAWFPGDDWLFSPGIVNWYEGPGWIGWSPQPPGRRPTSPGLGGGLLPRPPRGCPNACLSAVNIATFEKGGPIQPRQLINVNPAQGVPVRAPNFHPSLLAQLPGTPARMSSAQRSLVERGASEAAPESDHFSRISPFSGQWAQHDAPTTTFASPPSSVRGATTAHWGVAGTYHAPSGSTGGASHTGGVSSASRGGGGSGGGSASTGGGSHGGGGGSAGGGGGHH